MVEADDEMTVAPLDVVGGRIVEQFLNAAKLILLVAHHFVIVLNVVVASVDALDGPSDIVGRVAPAGEEAADGCVGVAVARENEYLSTQFPHGDVAFIVGQSFAQFLVGKTFADHLCPVAVTIVTIGLMAHDDDDKLRGVVGYEPA